MFNEEKNRNNERDRLGITCILIYTRNKMYILIDLVLLTQLII